MPFRSPTPTTMYGYFLPARTYCKRWACPLMKSQTVRKWSIYWAAVRKKGEYEAHLPRLTWVYQYNLRRSPCGKTASGYPRVEFWDYPSQILLSSDGKQVLDVVFPGDSNEQFVPLLPERYQTNFLDAYLQQNAADSQWLSPTTFCRRTVRGCFCWGSRLLRSLLGQRHRAGTAANCEP